MEKVFRHTHPYTTDTDIAPAERSNKIFQPTLSRFCKSIQRDGRMRYSVAKLTPTTDVRECTCPTVSG